MLLYSWELAGRMRRAGGAFPSALTALNFPGSAQNQFDDGSGTIKFQWSPPPQMYPWTFFWKCWPRSQDNYYAILFYGNGEGGAFDATNYYGFHPFADTPTAWDRYWEIAADGSDYTNGKTTPLATSGYNRWYTQAVRVYSAGDGKHHEYWWDYPDESGSKLLSFTRPSSYGSTPPANPVLCVGDAPWEFIDRAGTLGAPDTGEGVEVFNGYLRGFQFYDYQLTTGQMALVAQLETDAQVLSVCDANGMTRPWYLCMNPTPDDIANRGTGPNPAWYTFPGNGAPNKPTLFTL